jgi:hypothetical protein
MPRHLRALPDPEREPPVCAGGQMVVYRVTAVGLPEEGEDREYGRLIVRDTSVDVWVGDAALYSYPSLRAATEDGWRPD